MKFIPHAISRKIAEQGLMTRKHAPTILFGVGVVSMVGSTVLACRATLKLEETLEKIQADKDQAHQVSALVNDPEYKGEATYSDEDMRKDMLVIYVRGAAKVVKLYGPAVILGGIGAACLTQSHRILLERNSALAAAYVAVDQAFKAYRHRVVERYGEEADREMRYGSEEIDVIDDETGKLISTVRAAPGEPSGYARWFDDTNRNWSPHTAMHINWVFLRTQQNWANDHLRIRGHMFLNEVYEMVGLPHTTAGSIVGWLWDESDKKTEGRDYAIDFGCWPQERGEPIDFVNGREGAILLDFNVDGPIYHLMDERYGDKEQ